MAKSYTKEQRQQLKSINWIIVREGQVIGRIRANDERTAFKKAAGRFNCFDYIEQAV